MEPAFWTKSADISVRRDRMDRLENLSSLAEARHEQGCSCHLENRLQGQCSMERGFLQPLFSLDSATTESRMFLHRRPSRPRAAARVPRALPRDHWIAIS